jgi:excinuclease ABC subunit A
MADHLTLKIRNARENNLKDLTLDLPHNSLVGITGLSGSGKSSLAFDTIYAEGQRRYIETFSPYTRQFFDKVKRPKVDSIENVRPAIAIQQRTRILNSRSTVGSMTDINDLLKIVWSNLATPVCPQCGLPLTYWDPSTLGKKLERWCKVKVDSVFLIGAIVKNSPEIVDRLITLGYSRYFDTKTSDLLQFEDSPPAKRLKEVTVILDRCKTGSFSLKQVRESLEQAFALGDRSTCIIELRAKGSRSLLRQSVGGKTFHPSPTHEIHHFWNAYQCGDGEVRIERPRSSLFSFNHPIGACKECNGFGKILVIDHNKCIPDHGKTLQEHAIECWRGASAEWEFKHLLSFCKEQNIPINRPWKDLSAEAKNLIFTHKSKKFVGINPWFTYLEQKKYKMHVRVFLARYRGQVDCPTCKGTRLKPDALAYLIGTRTISDVWKLSLEDLLNWFTQLQLNTTARGSMPRQLKDVFENILVRLRYLVSLGLPYLTLERQARTLSGGETQRVNLVSAVGSNLISTHFVLDEPSVGLHARDTEELIKALRDLTDRGNSVTIVEHDPDCLAASDTIVELGPLAGERGGEIVFNGPRTQWKGLGMAPFKAQAFKPSFDLSLKIRNARNRNLKSLSVDIPLEAFVCLTGVSGSGKSSLLTEVIESAYQIHKGLIPPETTVEGEVSGFEHLSQVLLIDQSPLAKSPRANIATYTKVWDKVRDYLAATDEAAVRKLTKSAFSFNVNAGRCPTCEGAGYIREDMQFLSDVFIECESCLGMRFQAPVLEVRLRGKNVHELLCMTVDSCLEFFKNDNFISSVCRVLSQLGLGHATLGHPLSELSGGEAQRLKLVPHVVEGQRAKSLFLFDEPTTGLHVRDVERLLELFSFLRSQGHSILCVEHNLRLIAAADWIIDLGPEGGDRGGYVVKEGTPKEFIADGASSGTMVSLTAKYLGEFVEQYGSGETKSSAARLPSKKKSRITPASEIQILGAREHNLKNINVSLPLNKFITLTGVSGSGKSTIAKDILYAEGQRRYLDCLSPYARQFIKELKKPDLDDIRNIQPTICVYQHTFQPSALSTVATMSEVYNFLRLLFAKVGVQYCPDHPDQSISPLSAEQIAVLVKTQYTGSVRLLAPVIKGKKGNHRAVLQRAIDTEIGEVRVDGSLKAASRALEDGLAKTKAHSIEFVVARFNVKNLSADLIEEGVRQALSIAGGDVVVLSEDGDRLFSSERTCPICQRGFFKPDPEDLSFNSKRGRCNTCDGHGVVRSKPCPECLGARINEIGRHIKIRGKNIYELCSLNAPKLFEQITSLAREKSTREITEPIVRELEGKLGTLLHLGLDYISLNRDCATLSNGELQRLRLATAIGSPLSGVTYIFDEPSAGLHPADNKRLLGKLHELRDRGNTVIQIEHELDSILRSDLIIDVGPGAGSNGGNIVFTGSVSEALEHAESPTGEALRRPLEMKDSSPKKDGDFLMVTKASKNNLKSLNVSIPLRTLVTAAGVSGAGKSSLVHGVIVECLASGVDSKTNWKCPSGSVSSSTPIERFLVVNQQPIGKTSRSTPASYLGIWDEIRKLFAETLEAKSRGWTASYFSHNTGKGRCPTCKGQGELTLEMSFLAEAKVQCESCYGSRFTLEADSVQFRDLAISQVLKLTFEEARVFFINHRKVHQICKHACDLGLGYLTLGQPSSTLSGGESQRIKLVAELHVERKGHTLYILDEPTTGLHRSDVTLLLKGLETLVDQGHSVLLIEHDADTLAQSGWVIELGPGPGDAGGTVIFEGTPGQLLAAKTPWGEALRARVDLHKQMANAKAA